MRTSALSTRILAAAVVTTSSGACILKTDIVGTAFNGGALDSSNDPFRDPSMLAASRVERIVAQELADGYFQQGKDGEVGGWLANAAHQAERFVAIVNRMNAPPTASDPGAAERTLDAARIAPAELDVLLGLRAASRAPLCKPTATVSPPVAAGARLSGVPDGAAIELFLDDLRLRQAITRAARRVAALRLEGLVSDTAVRDGAAEAFRRTARYLNGRLWRRSERRKTAALAVEGGAATGIFSAGVVWEVLHLIDGWMTKHPCPAGNDADDACPSNITFRLISGTSTGAMVSVATDRFSAAKTQKGRDREMKNIAKWFTCYSFTDLMCVQSTGLLDLMGNNAKAIRGVLQFDGIQKVMTSCVKPWMFTDPAELILNTTEFRSGRIFAFSDQNELTAREQVVQSAVGSAQLPVIGEPATIVLANPSPFDLNYDAGDPVRSEQAYLDGGIRSELPILPLVRRGAERVLAVGSGASMINETKRITNADDVFSRYINVNTGAVMETELELVERIAESVRLAEIDACMSALDPRTDAVREQCDSDVGGGSASTRPFCNRWNICHGDLEHACAFIDARPYEAKRAEEDRSSLARRILPFWKMDTIFVDQSHVDSLSGYSFNPPALRRLFRAGAEAARVRCLDLARLLGILPMDRAPAAADVRDVNRWCDVRMDEVKPTCAGREPDEASFGVRACNKPLDLTKLPGYLDACPTTEDPE